LKFLPDLEPDRVVAVAPFTGAWIEMTCSAGVRASSVVAPFTGAWIEMCPA